MAGEAKNKLKSIVDSSFVKFHKVNSLWSDTKPVLLYSDEKKGFTTGVVRRYDQNIAQHHGDIDKGDYHFICDNDALDGQISHWVEIPVFEV